MKQILANVDFPIVYFYSPGSTLIIQLRDSVGTWTGPHQMVEEQPGVYVYTLRPEVSGYYVFAVNSPSGLKAITVYVRLNRRTV